MPIPSHSVDLLARCPAGTLGDSLAACQTADDARALLVRERIYGFAQSEWFTQLSEAQHAELTRDLRALRAIEAARQQARAKTVATALRAMHRAGIRPVVLKGGALARTLYAHTYQRPSVDIDLLIPPDAQDAVHACMKTLGWRLPFGVRGQYTSHQFSYYSPGPPLLQGVIDVHWRITNRPALAHVLSYPQLVDNAVDISFEGEPARAIDRAHAFVHALVHLVAHHANEPVPALWYYDIALLDTAMSVSDREKALVLITQLGLRPLAANVLGQCRSVLGLAPSETLASIGAWEGKALTIWSRMPASRATELLADLAALRGADRLRYLREVIAPNEQSLRAAFGDDAATPLWRLRLRRLRRLGVRREP